MVIDADSHVDETEETWSCVGDAERCFMPTRMMLADGQFYDMRFVDQIGPA